ncbi:MAG: cation:proton antiporter [Candidatus Altiarchaeota archaeon]
MEVSILVGFTICLTLAFLFSELFYSFKYPRVVGQIIAGIILGLPFIKVYFGEEFTSFISSLSDIGVVFLLLLVGTEVKVDELRKVSKRAIYLAVLGYIIPFTIGFLAMTMLKFEALSAVIVGICLAISAEAITVETLIEYKLLNTDVGATIMEAGMIDDFLGIFSLAAVIGIAQGGGIDSVKSMPGEFLTFIAIAYIIGFTILPKAAKKVWKEKSEAAVFSLAVIFGLIVVLLSNIFDLSSIVGAFVAGMIIQLSIKNKREEQEIVESLEIVTFGLVIPFFFIFIGMNFNVLNFLDDLPFILLLVTLALSGKMMAAHIMGARHKMVNVERTLIGWGINPRGAVELVIASIARANGLISGEVFSAIIAMAVIAALVSPVMFRRTLSSWKDTG